MSTVSPPFSAVEQVPSRLAIDLDRLEGFARDHAEGLEAPVAAWKFRGGQSNPTYALLGADGGRFVLRRKPPGRLIPGAHAVDREFRILKAMHVAGFPVARPIAHCTDESVVGTEFYLSEYVEGRVFADPTTPGLEPAERRAIHDDANRWLARIHTADIAGLALADLGRGENYTARNLKQWSDQYLAAQTCPIPDMDWLIGALSERVPLETPVRLLHGDYGLYNIMIHPHEPRIVAILDWEMSTLGDPFVDLAHHIRPWWLLPDPAGTAPTFIGRDLDALGLPAMEAYVGTYCERAGIPRFEAAGFYSPTRDFGTQP